MDIRMPRILPAKKILRRPSFNSNQKPPTTTYVPKGYLAVYVGVEEKKRFVIPVSFLTQPVFQELLNHAEEEFGFNHPISGLTIPCKEDLFIDVTSCLSRL